MPCWPTPWSSFLTNTFVWFAVTFWVYLKTQSVIATSVMAGVYSTTVAVSGFFLGSLVDRFPKKRVMLVSSVASLRPLRARPGALSSRRRRGRLRRPVQRPACGSSSCSPWSAPIVGNVRAIALSTLVTILVPGGRTRPGQRHGRHRQRRRLPRRVDPERAGDRLPRRDLDAGQRDRGDRAGDPAPAAACAIPAVGAAAAEGEAQARRSEPTASTCAAPSRPSGPCPDCSA